MKWASALTFLAGALTAAVSAAPYVLPFIQNRNLWAAGSMIAILLFISGHMFNHIRKVPYVAGDGRGGITYFIGGFQNQLGLETQIVAAMCMYQLWGSAVFPSNLSEGTPLRNIIKTRKKQNREKNKQKRMLIRRTDGILSFCTIALATKVPRMTSDKAQSVTVIVWVGVMFILYSLLLSSFRVKNASYPFALPPFM